MKRCRARRPRFRWAVWACRRTWWARCSSFVRMRPITSPGTPWSSTAGGCFSDLHLAGAAGLAAGPAPASLADDVRPPGDRLEPGAALCSAAGNRHASSDRFRARGRAFRAAARDVERDAALFGIFQDRRPRFPMSSLGLLVAASAMAATGFVTTEAQMVALVLV